MEKIVRGPRSPQKQSRYIVSNENDADLNSYHGNSRPGKKYAAGSCSSAHDPSGSAPQRGKAHLTPRWQRSL